jgi:hypothetical protein
MWYLSSGGKYSAKAARNSLKLAFLLGKEHIAVILPANYVCRVFLVRSSAKSLPSVFCLRRQREWHNGETSLTEKHTWPNLCCGYFFPNAANTADFCRLLWLLTRVSTKKHIANWCGLPIRLALKECRPWDFLFIFLRATLCFINRKSYYMIKQTWKLTKKRGKNNFPWKFAKCLLRLH